MLQTYKGGSLQSGSTLVEVFLLEFVHVIFHLILEWLKFTIVAIKTSPRNGVDAIKAKLEKKFVKICLERVLRPWEAC